MAEEPRKTILLVEDDVLIALGEKAALEGYGYSVLTEATGEKAVETVKANAGIDLVLMDINLGVGMDGTQAAGLILRDHDLPIVFVSSHSEREVVEKTEKITSYGYVLKSSSITVLDASIKMAFKLFDAHRSLRQAMATLRAGEERYALINNSSRDSIYSYDNSGRFTSANRSLCELLGLAAPDILGHSHAELGFPAAQCEEWQVLHDRVREGNRTVIAETTAPLADGQLHYFEVVLNPLHDDQGAIIGIGGSTRDITERKLAELALRESGEMFSALFQSVPSPAMIIDTANGRLVDVNEAMVANLGYSRDELIGARAVEQGFITQETEDRVRRLLEEGRGFQDFEIEVTTRSGEKRQGLASGQLIPTRGRPYLFQSIADITERTRLEDEVRESERRYRLLTESLKDVIWILDLASGYFSYMSPSVERLLGFSPEEILARPVATNLEPKDADGLPDLTAARAADFASGKVPPSEYYVDEVEQRRKDGSLVWTEVTTRYFRDERTGRIEILGLTHDISDRKAAEERIGSLLAEKDLILKEVHHRIKNNMATISGLLHLQASSLGEGPAVLALEDAERRVRSLMILYDKLYQSSGYGRIAIRDYLSTLVDEIVADFSVPARIEVVKDIEDLSLDARPVQYLGIIINELVTNAMKYAFPGLEAGTIRLRISAQAGLVRVLVEDDGRGLPASVDFGTTTGFGLKLVKGLADQLGGGLRIEREGGTRVVLEFRS